MREVDRQLDEVKSTQASDREEGESENRNDSGSKCEEIPPSDDDGIDGDTDGRAAVVMRAVIEVKEWQCGDMEVEVSVE